MAVNTKKVEGRRKVRYSSLDEFLQEAERLSQADVRMLGNWSQGQIYGHLARTMDGSIDGMNFLLPAPARFLVSLLMKRNFLYGALPAGFKSAPEFVPDDTSLEDELAALRKAVARQNEEPNRVLHPAFGNIGKEGWINFHLRHAELHMSFLVEAESE
ncbi:MAG: hypothetical protein ACI92S_000996 [Planctomycetaceae bacterium]|jgi:hypothetical protein